MNPRLAHDAAYSCALSIVECFSGLLREEERKDAFEAAYERVKAAIEAYAIMQERETKRLKPSRN